MKERKLTQHFKSLVLLEYLVKNGSERVVDDARTHMSMIKMMKNFHFVDEKGKDQGINGNSFWERNDNNLLISFPSF
jgi:epsin